MNKFHDLTLFHIIRSKKKFQKRRSGYSPSSITIIKNNNYSICMNKQDETVKSTNISFHEYTKNLQKYNKTKERTNKNSNNEE